MGFFSAWGSTRNRSDTVETFVFRPEDIEEYDEDGNVVPKPKRQGSFSLVRQSIKRSSSGVMEKVKSVFSRRGSKASELAKSEELELSNANEEMTSAEDQLTNEEDKVESELGEVQSLEEEKENK